MADDTSTAGSPITTWARLLRDIGFPIVVALILLYQIPPLALALERLSGTLVKVDHTLGEQLRELRAHREQTERNPPRRAREGDDE